MTGTDPRQKGDNSITFMIFVLGHSVVRPFVYGLKRKDKFPPYPLGNFPTFFAETPNGALFPPRAYLEHHKGITRLRSGVGESDKGEVRDLPRGPLQTKMKTALVALDLAHWVRQVLKIRTIARFESIRTK